jgi:hypothetical protein
VLGDQLGKSVGDMYAGAIGPSILQVLLFILFIVGVSIFAPHKVPPLPDEALTQRGWPLIWRVLKGMVPSIVLIFLTLVIQFGSIMNALLVLVAVPLGFIGVLTALFVFQSTLSLNSVLGVILLNGIAVANSIILVDFLKRLVDQGMDPVEAAVTAGKKRLRPIVITSLTTILGMLPIAIGMGEGGRILQPLGIAVSGGLWVSMGLTLFVVPALQVSYLRLRLRRSAILPQAYDGRFERPGARKTVAFVSGAIVADEVAAEAFAEGAPLRDQVSKVHRPEHLQ